MSTVSCFFIRFLVPRFRFTLDSSYQSWNCCEGFLVSIFLGKYFLAPSRTNVAFNVILLSISFSLRTQRDAVHSCFWYSVRIKRITIAKCELFFHYHYVKEISFYYFGDTKHEKTREFHLYCWDHVCKANEWRLVDCFHSEFGVSTQITVCTIASRNTKRFPPSWAFNGLCASFFSSSWYYFSRIPIVIFSVKSFKNQLITTSLCNCSINPVYPFIARRFRQHVSPSSGSFLIL